MSNGAEKAIDLVDAMIAGGEKAFKQFYQLSGGYWLDHAPEYFLVSHAASAIRATEKTTAWLEASVAETRMDAVAIRRGRPHGKDRRNGRYDIVLYWAKGAPRAAIEVKSPLWYADTGRLAPDFERLCKTLAANNDSTFQFCVFLYYASVAEPERTHKNARERLQRMMEGISEHADKTANNHGLVASTVNGSLHRGKEAGAWTIAACVFTRPGGERAFR